MKRTVLAVAAVLAFSPASSESIDQSHNAFSKFSYNNVGDVNSANMALGAPIEAFKLFCVTPQPAHPYRLELTIDPINSSYQEIDRSDQITSPGTWGGMLSSIGVGVYFPIKDGLTIISYAINHIYIHEGLGRSDALHWYYWRNHVYYDCIGSKFDGELSADLIKALKAAAAADRPSNKDRATPASPAYLQAVQNQLMPRLGAAAGIHSPMNGKADILIGGDGKLIRSSIGESSGDPVLDQAVTRAIRAIKVWPVPGDRQAKSISIGYGGY